MKTFFRGIRPDDLHGRMALRNPERGFRTEMYFSHIPGEIAGMCSCHEKQLRLDGRSEKPVYQNATIPNVPHLIRGNRLDGVEFNDWQWQDELDYFSYDGVTIMQSYCFLQKYGDGSPLPQAKLDDIEGFFLKVRRAGVKLLLRFAYELSPTLSGPTAETTLKHLRQLAPLIRRYSDVIYVLQCGFVGKFGEWHNSYWKLQDDREFRRTLFGEVLDILPPSRRTMVRYPWVKEEIYGVEPLSEELAFTRDPRARIGHFNDGFLANPPSHGGTFARQGRPLTVEEDFKYLDQETRFLPVDGELFWSDVGQPVLPTAATTLLNQWHFDTLGFVHGNAEFEGRDTLYSIDVWKRVPVDPMFLVNSGLPMSDGYFTDAAGNHIWRSYYEYIRDHLGYRLELQSAEVTVTDRVNVTIELVNRGFSSPVNPRQVYVRLGDKAYPVATDIQRWYGGARQTLTVEAPLPEKGKCAVGLWMPDEAETLRDRPEYAIRCANDIEFRDGVNWLCTLA